MALVEELQITQWRQCRCLPNLSCTFQYPVPCNWTGISRWNWNYSLFSIEFSILEIPEKSKIWERFALLYM